MTFLPAIRNSQPFSSGLSIVEEIESLGHQALFVGGCVRDLLLEVPCHDIDICTNAPMSLLEATFPSHNIGKNKDFGVIVVERGGHHFEVAQFRTESNYEDGRRPSEVSFSPSFEVDASRRDLTINALALDSKGQIIDCVGGKEDLKHKIIRAVGDAQNRFQEDGLRILRCIRFASRLNFNLHQDTFDAIQQNLHMLKCVSQERIKDELWKMASQKGITFAHSLELMKATGVLEAILPEVISLVGLHQHPDHHPEGDCFEHTLAAIRQNKVPCPLVNMSTLFHDLGKAATGGVSPEGHPTYHGHEDSSEEIAFSILNRLRCSTAEKESILFAVSNHMRFNRLVDMRPSKIVKMLVSPHIELLKQVAFCDTSCRLHAFRPDQWQRGLDRLEEVKVNLGERLHQPKILDGHKVMALLGIPGGKLLGSILKEVTAWIIDTNTTDTSEIEAKLRETHCKLV